MSADRPFDKCYQRGCKKPPVMVVRITFVNELDGKPVALSYCEYHGRFLAEYVPAISVVPVRIERLPLT